MCFCYTILSWWRNVLVINVPYTFVSITWCCAAAVVVFCEVLFMKDRSHTGDHLQQFTGHKCDKNEFCSQNCFTSYVTAALPVASTCYRRIKVSRQNKHLCEKVWKRLNTRLVDKSLYTKTLTLSAWMVLKSAQKFPFNGILYSLADI